MGLRPRSPVVKRSMFLSAASLEVSSLAYAPSVMRADVSSETSAFSRYSLINEALLTQLPAMGVEVATDPDNNLQVKIKEVV